MTLGIITIITLGFVIYVLSKIESAINSVANGLGNLYSQLDTTNLGVTAVADNLETFVTKLPDDTKLKLEELAAAPFLNSSEDANVAYQNGLKDGTTMTVQYVLGELENE